ncbi:MAG: hypothetical protein K2R93_15440 [Gemmatimonadaceae bacterium]|nr:hypothetical protein [Gemmatimonadaceae bacterium]
MFTTCIHCTAPLGANEAFETFPVGSRLAFDGRLGRLWVICRACDRWNLSPLDERWEAIEAMERRFRDTRLRVSTDNVGLARLKEGVDLIRIGEPQRPEMAAWRYGDQFGRRRKRQMLVTGAVVGSAAAILGGMVAIGVQIGSFAGVYSNGMIWDSLINGRPGKSIGHVRLPDGKLVDVQRRHARMSTLVRSAPEGPLQLRLEHVDGSTLVTGEEAMRIAARIMPTVNRFGGSREKVQDAVGLLEEAGDPYQVLWKVQQRHGWVSGDEIWGHGSGWGNNKRSVVKKLRGSLHTLDVRERLAIEMALHEEQERRAMEGELASLEAAWREAEEIAKIADNLFTPAQIESRLSELRIGAGDREARG